MGYNHFVLKCSECNWGWAPQQHSHNPNSPGLPAKTRDA